MKRREPEPKDAREGEGTIIDAKLAEMNRLHALELPRKNDSGNMLLEWEQTLIARELMNEYGVVPVHEERTGFWKLFGR